MKIIGADAVEAATTRGELRLGPDDRITPLARERAADLGVTVIEPERPIPGRRRPPARSAPGQATSSVPGPERSTPTSAVPQPRPHRPLPNTPAPAGASLPAADISGSPRPPSGALYRRGGPLPAGSRPPLAERVIVVGAGNVGMITALRLAEADVFAEVVLVDIDEGRAKGIALDLAHSAALDGFGTAVRGVGTVEEAGPAEYVVITAGKARQPGMSRSDLVSTNAEIVGDVARRVAATSPQAVLVVVTNPLDEMTQHAWRCSGFPPERVLGMAGVLDTARFQALVAGPAGGRADDVAAIALGSHGEEMVIPLSQARLGDRPLRDQVAPDALAATVDRARGSGAEVVGLLRSGSAFLTPGSSAARMVLAMVRDTGQVMPAAVLADGRYGIRDVYVGLPARLHRGGVREIVELTLEPDELAALRAAAERIRERVGSLTASS